MFTNRAQSGKLLAQKVKAALSRRKPLQNIVVALPRGGVPVALEVAKAVVAPLTVLVSKKIGAPFQPEYAIGAVSSVGVVAINKDTGIPADVLQPYIESERKRLSEITKEAELKWLHSAGLKQQLDFHGRRAIIVDDGIATGMTALAAADSLKELGAAEIIIATPVIASETKSLLKPHCQEIIAVLEPSDLGAIGLFYEDFHQVPDDEVQEALAHCADNL